MTQSPPPSVTSLEEERNLIHKSRLLRRIETNPLIPIGVVMAMGLLGYNINRAKHEVTNRSYFWMRTRVITQGGLIAILMAGSAFKIYKHFKDTPIDDKDITDY
ncbi:hypothetical protein ACOME3_002028 [Neoechinorhynchus agilis]